jgi:hypothetical protein
MSTASRVPRTSRKAMGTRRRGCPKRPFFLINYFISIRYLMKIAVKRTKERDNHERRLSVNDNAKGITILI